MITALVQNKGKFYPATNNRAGHSAEALTRAVGLEMLHFTIGASSLGKVLVATSENGVCAVLLGSEDKSLIADLKGRNPRVVLMQGGDVVETTPAPDSLFFAVTRRQNRV